MGGGVAADPKRRAQRARRHPEIAQQRRDFTTIPDNAPPEAPTITDAVEPVTVFPYASTTRTTGCVDNTAPDAPATGCVTISNRDGVPYPVAVTGAVAEVRPVAENVNVAGVEFDPE